MSTVFYPEHMLIKGPVLTRNLLGFNVLWESVAVLCVPRLIEITGIYVFPRKSYFLMTGAVQAGPQTETAGS